MKKTILVIAVMLLIAVEISRVYFIMPFPGSQRSETIAYAYWIHNNLLWIRLVLIFTIGYLLLRHFRSFRMVGKTLIVLALVFYAVVFYFFNFRFQADRMFIQPRTKDFAAVSANKVDSNKLVLGITVNGESKAYPIQFIGYHHQVRDTVGHMPVIVTYCTVCRTGRVFSPEVNGRQEEFRLVGMDHFNAMFEDKTTGSWWQQATGEAVAGPLKGERLKQLPSQQSTLASWAARYPNTMIFQGDTMFNKQYASLKDFDDGSTEDELEKRDSSSWEFKSWIVGVNSQNGARAYDWNRIVKEKLINDTVGDMQVLITLESDTASFHVLNRLHNNESLVFRQLSDTSMTDSSTGSVWSIAGVCVDGPLKGGTLAAIQSSQEFWHSWKTFNPLTTKY